MLMACVSWYTHMGGDSMRDCPATRCGTITFHTVAPTSQWLQSHWSMLKHYWSVLLNRTCSLDIDDTAFHWNFCMWIGADQAVASNWLSESVHQLEVSDCWWPILDGSWGTWDIKISPGAWANGTRSMPTKWRWACCHKCQDEHQSGASCRWLLGWMLPLKWSEKWWVRMGSAWEVRRNERWCGMTLLLKIMFRKVPTCLWLPKVYFKDET